MQTTVHHLCGTSSQWSSSIGHDWISRVTGHEGNNVQHLLQLIGDRLWAVHRLHYNSQRVTSRKRAQGLPPIHRRVTSGYNEVHVGVKPVEAQVLRHVHTGDYATVAEGDGPP